MSKIFIQPRISKDDYYLGIAKQVAARGTCIRRNYGAVIVNNDVIVATGYTGAPRGAINCCEVNECLREIENIPSGQNYEKCRSVHAEANAIMNAGRERCLGASLYIAGFDYRTGEEVGVAEPCFMCQRLIINAGIKEVIIHHISDYILKTPVEAYITRNNNMIPSLQAKQIKEDV